MPESEFRLSPKAREDMESVWLYTLSQWGHEQTEKYIDDLAAAAQYLTSLVRGSCHVHHIQGIPIGVAVIVQQTLRSEAQQAIVDTP